MGGGGHPGEGLDTRPVGTGLLVLARDESPTDKGMPLVDSTAPDTVETVSRSRRAILGGLLATGATVAFAGRASAADSTDTTVATGDSMAPTAMMDSAAVTTTTAPPARSSADNAALNAMIAREADIVATYDAALGSLSGDDLAAVELIKQHHTAYIQSLSGYLGRAAIQPNGQEMAVPLTGYGSAALVFANIEAGAVEANIKTLAGLQGLDAANLVASIITVEARHQAALGVAATGDVQWVAK